jgi:outer membrane protein assembly factor BamB
MANWKSLLAAGCLTAVLGAATVRADPWPQWRGPDRNDISKEKGLLDQWPKDGPKKLWMNKDAGLGYAGFAVVGDTLYTLGAHGTSEYIIALNTKDGTEKWKAEIAPLLTNGWGDGPRGTPTVDGDHVYALSGKGVLACVTAADGKVVWKTPMADLGGKVPGWGYTESPLVDGDKVVCTPGGSKGAIAALDKKTGKPIWQSKDFTEGAQYSSIIKADVGGKPQYVQLTMKKLVGVDPATGNVIWTSDWPGATAVIPTPIYQDGLVFVTSGYNVGCKLVKIGEGQAVDVYPQSSTMVNHHGGVVLVGKHLYGYSDKNGWTCMEFETGKQVWAEKKALGKGCLTYADGKLYCLGEGDGQVVLIDASPDGWKEHGRFKLDPQTTQRSQKGKIWTHPVVSDGKLYLRDQELLFCFDVKK